MTKFDNLFSVFILTLQAAKVKCMTVIRTKNIFKIFHKTGRKNDRDTIYIEPCQESNLETL